MSSGFSQLKTFIRNLRLQTFKDEGTGGVGVWHLAALCKKEKTVTLIWISKQEKCKWVLSLGYVTLKLKCVSRHSTEEPEDFSARLTPAQTTFFFLNVGSASQTHVASVNWAVTGIRQLHGVRRKSVKEIINSPPAAIFATAYYCSIFMCCNFIFYSTQHWSQTCTFHSATVIYQLSWAVVVADGRKRRRRRWC